MKHTDEIAGVLHKRAECLRHLVTRPQSKRELVETLGIPRSTLDDIVRELERANLVEYRDGTWHPTQLGSVASSVHRDYRSKLDSIVDVAPVLDGLDADNEISPEFIDGADVYEATSNIPDAPMVTLLDHAEAAAGIRIATPSISIGYADQFYRKRIRDDDTSLEIVLPREVCEQWNALSSVSVTEIHTDPDVTVLHAHVPSSFGVVIFDEERAGVTVFTDRGIAGLVVNDTDSALEWAEKRYDRIKQDGTLIPPQGDVRPQS